MKLNFLQNIFKNKNTAFYKKIPKEVLNELPTKSFEGELYIVSNEEDASFAVNELKNMPVLGFDTETKPAFKKGVFHNVALLQLSSKNKAFIFQLKKTGLSKELADILSDKNIIKTGVAIRDDIKALKKLRNFTPNGFVELQKYSDDLGIEDNGLKNLSGNVLGFKISKGARLTNWDNDKLTENQQKYAATDAWVSYLIYDKLSQIN